MKNSKKCPKCSSTDVVLTPNNAGAGGVTLGFLTYAAMVRYVCCGCGYAESYVDNPEDLEAVKEVYGGS